MFYILNSFSPNMLSEITSVVKFIKLNQGEARAIFNEVVDNWENKKNPFVSAIGHEATAKLVSVILYSEIPFNRTEVKLNSNDYGLIFTLSFRPEEGKIYDYLELCKFMDEGKISIYYFKVINEVINE